MQLWPSVSVQKPEEFLVSHSHLPEMDLGAYPPPRYTFPHALKPELDQALRPRAQPWSSHPYWIPSYPETDKQAMSQHWGVSSLVAYWVTCGAFKSYEYHLSPQLIDFDSTAFSIFKKIIFLVLFLMCWVSTAVWAFSGCGAGLLESQYRGLLWWLLLFGAQALGAQASVGAVVEVPRL